MSFRAVLEFIRCYRGEAMTRRNKRSKGLEEAPLTPGWVNAGENGDSSLSQSEYWRLYDFYVLHTPCEKYSSSSVSIMRYGWTKNVWRPGSANLRDKLLDECGFASGDNLFIGTAVSETKALFREAGLTAGFHKQFDERIAIYKEPQVSVPKSILGHIRCSLAHGRFSAYRRKGCVFIVLEDGVKAKGKTSFFVRSRMVLKLTTLLKWIDICKRKD